MSKTLKIGMVGAGGIAEWNHLPALSQFADVEIVAICDENLEKAKKVAEKFGIPNVFRDRRELLALPDLDAVDICTPNYLHSIVAVEALEKGMHVICEKPDAINGKEAEKMKMAAEKNGKVWMAIRNNRYMPISAYLKKYIEEGRMGEIYAARCGWQRRKGVPTSGWFAIKELSGGGPLIDLGVHMIDLTMWLMGNPKPVAVSGSVYNKLIKEMNIRREYDVEDLAMGYIRFENGACMQIEFSWASHIESDNKFFELRGTKAGAVYSSRTETLSIYTQEDGQAVDYHPEIDNNNDTHKDNLRHFVDVVLYGKEPEFVPEQGLNMVKILEAVYESSEKGHEILL